MRLFVIAVAFYLQDYYNLPKAEGTVTWMILGGIFIAAIQDYKEIFRKDKNA